jgi:hypothetical protein
VRVQDYGAYVVDDTGSQQGGGAFCAEVAVSDEVEREFGYSIRIENPLSPSQGAALYYDLIEACIPPPPPPSYCNPSPAPPPAALFANSVLTPLLPLQLFRALYVVVNNAPDSIGGGGVPRQPPPPPICDV